jgi:hypothetical protein
MIELRQDALVCSFPEVHPEAELRVEFQRTLRIPDDGRDHFLPPGLGPFPLRHVDDFAARLTPEWRKRGGVMLPMYQSEAMWLNFSSPHGYPFAVKIAAGKINAVTGEAWTDGLKQKPQDYVAIPKQPWLDGFCVERGVIRQFVAMPLGSGYSAEEQLTGQAEHGGVQLVVYPLKAEAWERRQRHALDISGIAGDLACSASSAQRYSAMGLAPGGRMRQEIFDDPQQFSDWDNATRSRCFVHLANALVWRAITGENPPTTPPTAAEYTRRGLPWFDYYGGDLEALGGGERLKGLKSVATLGQQKGDRPLPENESVEPQQVVGIPAKRTPHQVREGVF